MVEAKESTAQRLEHAPGDAAPAAGTYEQLNIFDRPISIQVTLLRNHPFPEAPIGHSWVHYGVVAGRMHHMPAIESAARIVAETIERNAKLSEGSQDRPHPLGSLPAYGAFSRADGRYQQIKLDRFQHHWPHLWLN